MPKQRLSGLEPRPDAKYEIYTAEREAFPEYYEAYMARAMLGGNVAKVVPLYCVGPLDYAGREELERDLANLRAALDATDCAGAFVPATAPSGIGWNDYYGSEEEFFFAAADAMRTEYKAIVGAGFFLQVDDPFLSDIFGDPKLDAGERVRKADMYVESINHGLRGLPEEKIRFHTCYGINEGPRIFEPQLGDVIDHILQIDASIYSFEAANPRHEHDYHVFETVRLPEGRKIMPGMITHASNIVEHPELIAEWLVRFAGLVGREKRRRRRGLRLLLPGLLPYGGPPDGHLGQVQGTSPKARGWRARNCGERPGLKVRAGEQPGAIGGGAFGSGGERRPVGAADRMLDHGKGIAVGAQHARHQFRCANEGLGHDAGGRNPEPFSGNRIVQTARRAAASVADPRQPVRASVSPRPSAPRPPARCSWTWCATPPARRRSAAAVRSRRPRRNALVPSLPLEITPTVAPSSASSRAAVANSVALSSCDGSSICIFSSLS